MYFHTSQLGEEREGTSPISLTPPLASLLSLIVYTNYPHLFTPISISVHFNQISFHLFIHIVLVKVSDNINLTKFNGSLFVFIFFDILIDFDTVAHSILLGFRIFIFPAFFQLAGRLFSVSLSGSLSVISTLRLA